MTAQPAFDYLYDPARSESVLARKEADDALQRAAGRKDSFPAQDREFKEPGGRYIDFLIPGLLGMSIMGGGLWGVGFVTVDMRIRKLLKRFLATPMKKTHFLAAVMLSRMCFLIPEVVVLIVFAAIVFGVKIYGSVLATGVSDSAGQPDVLRLRASRRQPRENHRSRFGTDEPRHAADVDAVGHFLFVEPLSGRGAAPHQASAADRPHRRAACA